MNTLNFNDTMVFALGGLNEVGKNLYCIEHMDTIILIDSGVLFPDAELYGVDYVIPDFSYLLLNQYKIKALFITHGHEDHIGSIPFLLQKINVPIIYAGRLAAALIRNKLEEARCKQKVNIVEVNGESEVNINDLKIKFFDTTHSIPDSLGICIDTPNGTIVTTGDFKIDLTPVGQHIDLFKISEIGRKGVTLLLSDSTNAEAPGLSLSESAVVQQIQEVFKNTFGRLIIATFASNIHRIQQIVEASVKFNRKVCILGRSMEKTVAIGRSTGYIRCKDSDIIQEDNIKMYKDNELCILCTGSQGEALAALSRISNGTHKSVKIVPGDTIVLSSSVIPGNGASINKLVNNLFRQGAEVITNSILNNIHASGHANQEELKYMMSLLKPKYFMPVHGEYRMLKIHTQLAHSLGIPKENTFILSNGDTLILRNGEVFSGGRISCEDIYVDGKDTSGLSTAVIRDRKILSSDGFVCCLLPIDSKTNTLLARPTIVTKGFMFIKENDKFIQECIDLVIKEMNHIFQQDKVTFSLIKNDIKETLSKFIYEKTNRNPIIIPVTMNKKDGSTSSIDHMVKKRNN